jgi:hypothetical protein
MVDEAPHAQSGVISALSHPLLSHLRLESEMISGVITEHELLLQAPTYSVTFTFTTETHVGANISLHLHGMPLIRSFLLHRSTCPGAHPQ